jgi:CRISPR-associated protein, NE0113 family
MGEKRKILVAVTGMSPQIVTETLYALVVQQQWLPDEVHVLTTGAGAEKIRTALFANGHADGHFARFCSDYAPDGIGFTPEHIHLIRDAQGNVLDDIRTPAENNLAADMIVRFIHDLCREEDTALHVSIAGGRKSMGFYIGYALSLFGRVQDRLSHVLINEPFEANRDFFFPPRVPQWIDTPQGKVSTDKAEVMLADIPFVRMRDGMPNLVLDANWTYGQAVEQTQLQWTDWRIEIDVVAQSLRFGNTPPLKLPLQQFALYAAMVRLYEEGKSVGRKDMELLARHFREFYSKEYADNGERYSDFLASSNYEEMHRILREGSARIFKALNKHLGAPAEKFRITSSGRNNARVYGLAMGKAQIVWR